MSATIKHVQEVDRETRISTLIVAKKDFFLDGMVRILKSSQLAGEITCLEPGEPCMQYFIANSPTFILIQENAKPEPFDEFIKEMVEGYPDMRLLVFGQSMSDDYLYRIISAGAHGYFNEKMGAEHIVQALKAVKEGHYWVERHIMERFIADRSMVESIHARVRSMGDRLTNRELEVLEMLMQGLSTGEIAERIFLSHQGVKAHLTTLFRKFNVRNRSQLILSALNEVSPVDSITEVFQQGLQAYRQPEKPVAENGNQRQRMRAL